MQTVFAWIFVPALLLAGYPWAVWLLTRNPHFLAPSRWLLAALTLALGAGALTLVMFWQMLLGFPLSFWAVTLVYLLLILPGWLLWRRSAPDTSSAKGTRKRAALAAPLLVVVGAVLLNAAYWPLHRDDALAIYRPQAHLMAESRSLPPLRGEESLYHSYPPLVPLSYTYAYLASGWSNDYLAGFLVALLALGCLPAAFALGALIQPVVGGWLSVLILALTPTFAKWAASGYADLPAAFFYTLSALFAFRLWLAPHWAEAVLAGASLGLALWAKNSTLIGVPVLGLWLLWAVIRGRVPLRLALLALASCAVVAGPWYARNAVTLGVLAPDTAWTDRAQRTVESLVVFAARFQNFGPSGWIITAGLILLVVLMLRGLYRDSGMVLLWWTVPFFAAWWLFASYDPRLLLPAVPAFAVIGGVMAARAASAAPPRWRPRLVPLGLGFALVLAVSVGWNTVEFKDDMLRDPFMSHDSKRVIVLGDAR